MKDTDLNILSSSSQHLGLRHRATSQKGAGSIPVIGIFH